MPLEELQEFRRSHQASSTSELLMAPGSQQLALDEDFLTAEVTVQNISSIFKKKRNPKLQFWEELCSHGCIFLLQSILEETPTWS